MAEAIKGKKHFDTAVNLLCDILDDYGTLTLMRNLDHATLTRLQTHAKRLKQMADSTEKWRHVRDMQSSVKRGQANG